MKVREAEDGEPVNRGTAYIAPGHSHMRIRRGLSNWCIELDQGETVNRHRPSVDVLFDSAAQRVGRDCIGVIMTGMGKDGAQGMLHASGRRLDSCPGRGFVHCLWHAQRGGGGGRCERDLSA